MEKSDNNEFNSVYIQEIDSRLSWQCTPLLLFFYFLVFISGFFSFTIANGVAIFYETGIWQIPEPVLEFSGKSFTSSPNFRWNNYYAISLHILAFITMIYYDSAISDYKSGLLFLGGFSIFTSFCAIYFQVLTVENFVTEMLQTTEGISLMKNILIGIVIIQVLLTLILVFLRCMLDTSIVKLPEMNSNYEMAAYLFLPIIILFTIQNFLYDSLSLDPTILKILLIGVAGIYLAQWEKSRY